MNRIFIVFILISFLEEEQDSLNDEGVLRWANVLAKVTRCVKSWVAAVLEVCSIISAKTFDAAICGLRVSDN